MSQRLRKADALEEEAALVPHLHKGKVTFAERQNRWKRHSRHIWTAVAGVLGRVDQIFGFTDYRDSDDESQSASPVVELGKATGAQAEKQLKPAMGRAVRKASRRRAKIKLGSSVKRLFSGAVAGAVSRTAVAPLETIRTHLMVGSGGGTSMEVFDTIMAKEGWKGLFRGNGINMIRVIPSRAIELYTFDMAKKLLHPYTQGENAPLKNVPISLFSGSAAGVASTLATYPLELVKTRITVQPGVYKGIIDAFAKIAQKEGFFELYRGLLPSLIGIVPYAGSNYYAYDSLKAAHRKFTKRQHIKPAETLMLGSLAGAIACTATFPLEVARKQMQVGALGGRKVYGNLYQALTGVVKEKGVGGLYFGLAPSCIKLMPAAGISFMCYEVLKRVLIEEDIEAEEARDAADAKVAPLRKQVEGSKSDSNEGKR